MEISSRSATHCWLPSLILLLCYTLPALGQSCIPNDLPTMMELRTTTRIQTQPAAVNQQWIFPSLKFSCSVNITGWVIHTTSDDITDTTDCPTIELWKENTITPTVTTDYRKKAIVNIEMKRPERLSAFVYYCKLITPLLISADSVFGFTTEDNTDSTTLQVQLKPQSGTVGYHRATRLGVLFDAVNDTSSSPLKDIAPLIKPVIDSEDVYIILEPTPTPTPTPSPSPSPSSTPSSTPPCYQPSTTDRAGNLDTSSLGSLCPTNSDENEGDEDSMIQIIAIVVPLSIGLVVIVAIVISVLGALLLRQRQQLLHKTTPNRPAAQNTMEESSIKIEHCQSMNTTHDYEDIVEMGLELSKKHEYEVINAKARATVPSVWSPNGYEVPFPPNEPGYETAGTYGTHRPSSGIYETPGKIITDHYEMAPDIKIGLRCGAKVADTRYEVPMEAQGDISCAAQGRWSDDPTHSAKERMVESPNFTNQSFTRGQLKVASPTHYLQPSEPIAVPGVVHDVLHSDNSLVFMQSVIHQEVSL